MFTGLAQEMSLCDTLPIASQRRHWDTSDERASRHCTHLVVTLAGGAVRNVLRPFLLRNLDLTLRDHWPSKAVV